MTRFSVEYPEMEGEGRAMEKAMASMVMAAGGSGATLNGTQTGGRLNPGSNSVILRRGCN